MRKCKDMLEARREHIRDRVNASKKAEAEIRRLSRELFLSERTILNDLKK
jgi:DeoR/GlpR family transcriptional regulator of sugar metabolism